jgi:hypothetical protein
MSNTVSNIGLHFLPPTLELPKRKARHLWKAYRARTSPDGKRFSLSIAQQITEQVRGYADWHIRTILVAIRRPVFDVLGRLKQALHSWSHGVC